LRGLLAPEVEDRQPQQGQLVQVLHQAQALAQAGQRVRLGGAAKSSLLDEDGSQAPPVLGSPAAGSPSASAPPSPPASLALPRRMPSAFIFL